MFKRFRRVASVCISVAVISAFSFSSKPASAYTILEGIVYKDLRNAALTQAALAGATSAALLTIDAVVSHSFGIPTLYEELNGTANPGLPIFCSTLCSTFFSGGLAYAEPENALAYAPRRRDPSPMFTKAIARPLPTWAGFYVGGNIGASFGTNIWRDTFGDIAGVPGDELAVKSYGVTGGGVAGYNFQAGRWVYGVEGSFSGTSLEGNTKIKFTDPLGTFSSRANWFASITGRVGYTLPTSLFYVKGGIAFAEFNDSFRLDGSIGPFVFPGETQTKTGWTVGAGIERALNNKWSLRYEWDYSDFGRQRYDTFLPAFGPARVDINRTVNTVTLGLNYRFNTPIEAKY